MRLSGEGMKVNAKVRVLVSGFEAFLGGSSNPSGLICDALMSAHFESDESDESNFDLAIVILPVTFAEAFERLSKSIESFKPDVILCLGQAGGRKSIDFERVAINMIESEVPDNSGQIYRETLINLHGPVAYFSALPLETLRAALRQARVPVSISNTAGLYVCNFLFYKLMEFIKVKDLSIIAGFAHLPYLPGQAQDALTRQEVQSASTGAWPGEHGLPEVLSADSKGVDSNLMPSMEFDLMLSGVQIAVEILVASTNR